MTAKKAKVKDEVQDAPVEGQTDVPEVTEGAPGESININPGELAEGIMGANNVELNLVLEVLRQFNFSAWDDKIVAGQVQRRVVYTLESRNS